MRRFTEKNIKKTEQAVRNILRCLNPVMNEAGKKSERL